LLTGKKLLVADDSVAIQKVVDLTFTDEGMEVTVVGDGDQARDRLEEIAPDIVLADALMPGVDGYELCRIIRQSERLWEIPVILLVGSFEPFNEAEARLAGASDIVTKPFQSIRDLVSRVGSLLGKKSEDAGAANEYSTLGLGRPDEKAPTASADYQPTGADLKVFVEAPSPDDESMKDTNLSVMVEAAPIPEHEPAESAGASCATDVELQTADTRQLERIDDEVINPSSEPLYAQDDTIEIEPVREMNAAADSVGDVVGGLAEKRSWQAVEVEQPATPAPSADMFSDSLLDLGEFENAAVRAVDDDVVLDLDFEAPAPLSETWAESVAGSLATRAVANGSPNRLRTSDVGIAEAPPEAERAAQTEVPQRGVVPPPAQMAPISSGEAEAAAAAQTSGVSDLWPEGIDVIARRLVEQMSERIVREIVWEVVPELAELLIKQRLDEKKLDEQK
jgi:CheY-like chemotaxis protein